MEAPSTMGVSNMAGGYTKEDEAKWLELVFKVTWTILEGKLLDEVIFSLILVFTLKKTLPLLSLT